MLVGNSLTELSVNVCEITRKAGRKNPGRPLGAHFAAYAQIIISCKR